MNNNQIPPVCEPTGTPAQTQTGPPPRILVVDDDASIRRFTSEVLIASGYEVDTAEDGAIAWNALQLNNYDLLVTDNNMPNVSGVELLEMLHAARMTLPAIMASGAEPKEFTRFPWLRPAATLLKPFTLEEMVRTVKQVLHEVDDAQMSIDFDLKNFRNPPAARPAYAAPPGPAISSPRILVVDEDRDLRILYAEALARPGYEVDAAEDGEAGWEALQTRNYNLLITENDMPKLTGVELVEKLRAARMALPVVMAASRLPTHELSRNPSLQLAATLAKPFPVEVLVDTVRSVLHATDDSPTQMTPSNGQAHPPADGWQL